MEPYWYICNRQVNYMYLVGWYYWKIHVKMIWLFKESIYASLGTGYILDRKMPTISPIQYTLQDSGGLTLLMGALQHA